MLCNSCLAFYSGSATADNSWTLLVKSDHNIITTTFGVGVVYHHNEKVVFFLIMCFYKLQPFMFLFFCSEIGLRT